MEPSQFFYILAHKKQACLNEIQRLKLQGAMASKGKSSRRKDAGLPKTVTSTNGSISISDIRLPLKREFLDHIVKGAGG